MTSSWFFILQLSNCFTCFVFYIFSDPFQRFKHTLDFFGKSFVRKVEILWLCQFCKGSFVHRIFKLTLVCHYYLLPFIFFLLSAILFAKGRFCCDVVDCVLVALHGDEWFAVVNRILEYLFVKMKRECLERTESLWTFKNIWLCI